MHRPKQIVPGGDGPGLAHMPHRVHLDQIWRRRRQRLRDLRLVVIHQPCVLQVLVDRPLRARHQRRPRPPNLEHGSLDRSGILIHDADDTRARAVGEENLTEHPCEHSCHGRFKPRGPIQTLRIAAIKNVRFCTFGSSLVRLILFSASSVCKRAVPFCKLRSTL